MTSPMKWYDDSVARTFPRDPLEYDRPRRHLRRYRQPCLTLGVRHFYQGNCLTAGSDRRLSVDALAHRSLLTDAQVAGPRVRSIPHRAGP